MLGQFRQGGSFFFFFFFFLFAVRPTASESICRCKGTYEGCDSAPLDTSSEGILTNLTFSRSL